MIATAQQKQADSAYSRSFIPTGVDCGAGLIKVCVDSNGSQMRLRQPSKVLELKTALIDDLTSKEGGHFFYHLGDRTDLIGREFLTGELAAWKAPTTHIKLSDDPDLKAEYCLHSIFGALAPLPHRQEWNLFVVISTHSRDLFNAKLKELTNGVHIVSFNGKTKPHTRVTITIGTVAPKGAGSYTYAKRLNIIDPSAHVIGDKLSLCGSCQGDLRRGWKKNWSEPRCCSGKGATINLRFGFRCCLTIPKSWFSLAAKYLTGSVAMPFW